MRYGSIYHFCRRYQQFIHFMKLYIKHVVTAHKAEPVTTTTSRPIPHLANFKTSLLHSTTSQSSRITKQLLPFSNLLTSRAPIPAVSCQHWKTEVNMVRPVSQSSLPLQGARA